MISYIYANDLPTTLRTDMFQSRRQQFSERLGWDLNVNENGEEIDEYDGLNPLYIIGRDKLGRHTGSLRMLPTMGPTMINDHFSEISGMTIQEPQVWEATRFTAAPHVASHLLLASCELGLRFGLRHCIGVFDTPMVRVYRKLGWSPEVIGESEGISVGVWTFSEEVRDALCARHNILGSDVANWYDRSFPAIYQQAA